MSRKCSDCGQPATHRYWDKLAWAYFCPKHADGTTDEPLRVRYACTQCDAAKELAGLPVTDAKYLHCDDCGDDRWHNRLKFSEKRGNVTIRTSRTLKLPLSDQEQTLATLFATVSQAVLNATMTAFPVNVRQRDEAAQTVRRCMQTWPWLEHVVTATGRYEGPSQNEEGS